MRNKSDFTEILDEKIVTLKSRKIVVTLVKTQTIGGRKMIRAYCNFLKNNKEDKNGDKTSN